MLFPVVKPYFSALHLNIRSFNQHFADLCSLLDSTPFTFDFIGCSVTWLSPRSYLDCFSIPGYVFINDNRTYSSGSGVGLYIKSDRNFHLRDDLRIDTMHRNTRLNYWCYIYKPPSLSNRDFLDKLKENLHTIYLSKKKCLIMGDDNINTLKTK